MITKLPRMLMGDDLIEKLTILPEYDKAIRTADTATRLMALSDIYQIYIPSTMSVEIYSKMYLAMIRSLQKKTLPDAIKQRNDTFRNMGQGISNGIIGGSDSFTIIGSSGIGKSSAIFSAMRLMGADKVLENEKPFMKVIPVLNVQCPFDCSTKSLLLNILQIVDEKLGTNYCASAVHYKTTTDYLISMVSQCCLNNVGLLVVDEIQNVVLHKNGFNLIGCLTQLINSSGISIAMVGTPAVTDYFNKEMQMARRALGLQYSALEYDIYFENFCRTVFSYQYVSNETTISDSIIEWLYEHSSGIISVVISLIHDAQEIAIVSGREKLDMEALNLAYDGRMRMLHSYINPSIVRKKNASKRAKERNEIPQTKAAAENKDAEAVNVYELAMWARNANIDAATHLSQFISVTKVKIGGK